MHIHDWRIFFIFARMREEPGPTFMSPSSRSRWYRECQRTKRHRLVSNWRCLRGAGGPRSIQSGRSFPRTGSCVHIRRAPLREETLMEKEAKMPVTADQRPLWNTQRQPEDSSLRSTAAAACRAAGAPLGLASSTRRFSRLRQRAATACGKTRPTRAWPVVRAIGARDTASATLFACFGPIEIKAGVESAGPLALLAYPHADPDTRPPAEGRPPSRSGKSLPRPLPA
jgi:hypothetical protein